MTTGAMVSEIMTAGVVSLPDDASLRDACRAMDRHSVHAILVVGNGGVHRGFVTAPGLLARRGMDVDLLPLAEALDEPAIEVPPTASVESAAALLDAPGTSHLLVCRGDGRPPEGIVTALDVIRALT